MEQHQFIREVEATAKLAGVSMKQVCERARVHQATVSKWKASDGPKATYEGLMRLRRAVDSLLHAELKSRTSNPTSHSL